MSYFFRWFFVLLFFCRFASAADIMAIYSNSCDRTVGVPLDVDISNIYFLAFDGMIKKIPRYNVMAIAVYPLGEIPIKEIKNELKKKDIYSFSIKTLYNNDIIPLVRGWPVQFTKDKVSFLNHRGREILVDRQNIWELELLKTPRFTKLRNDISTRYEFVHPFRQYDCPRKFYGPSHRPVIKVFPQEYISNQVTIKRRFDTMMDYLLELRDYHREQKFYAVPQVYKNQTTIGYWISGGRSLWKKSKSR